jgi:hypothetical protein
MEPTKELIDALYRDKVLAARQMKPSDKFLAGARLFDFACRITMSGIRDQNPGVNDEQVLEILRQRLALARRLEQSDER